MDETAKKSPPLMRLRSEETDYIYSLYAALQEIDNAKRDMERRFRAIPGGWRDISMLSAVLTRLMEKVIATIPPEKRMALHRNARHMTYRVYLVPPVTGLPPDEVVVKGDDLNALLKTAHSWNCFACDKNCNQCDLGKAFDHVMIQCRKRNESWAQIDMEADTKEDDLQ